MRCLNAEIEHIEYMPQRIQVKTVKKFYKKLQVFTFSCFTNLFLFIAFTIG